MAAKTYTTGQGDMWDQIARDQLGSELLMGQLIAANPAHASTVIFSAGVVLSVPDVSPQPTLFTQPPWKVSA